MPNKTSSGFLFTILVIALLISGVYFNRSEVVSSATPTMKVDNTPPTTSHDYDGSWHTSNFSITVATIDNDSGVNETYYQINGGPVKNVSADGQPLITEESKNNVLIYWSADNAGNQEPHKTLSAIKLDKTVPTGSIKINDGAASTTSTQVKLTLSSEDSTSGVSQMRFFDLIYGEWEEYAISRLWTFKTGDAYKTVYVQFKDNAGLVSAPYPATIYFGSNLSPDPFLGKNPENPSSIVQNNSQEIPQEKPLPSNPPQETAPTTILIPTTHPTVAIIDTNLLLLTIGLIITLAIVGITCALKSWQGSKRKKMPN